MNKSNDKTFKLTATALLVTLGVVLSRFAVVIPLFGFPAIRFGFAMFPVVVVGALFGGIYGAVAGFLVDILGYIIAPLGVYHPGFTLNMIATGAISGVFFQYIKSRKEIISFYWINLMVIALLMLGGLLYVNVWGVPELVEDTSLYISRLSASVIVIIMGSLMMIGSIVSSRKQETTNNVFSMDKLIFINIVIYLVVNLALTPIWLNQLYNLPIALSVVSRIFKSLVDIPLYVAVQYGILVTLYQAREVRRWLVKQV